MADLNGYDLEEMGLIALIGVILTPGMFWIGSAKGVASRVRRIAVVAGVVAAAVAVEASIDRSAESLADEITGGA